jgi:hypothetical protein
MSPLLLRGLPRLLDVFALVIHSKSLPRLIHMEAVGDDYPLQIKSNRDNIPPMVLTIGLPHQKSGKLGLPDLERPRPKIELLIMIFRYRA